MVKEQVEMARARVRVLVLDCCFSGQALGWQSAAAVVDEAAAAAGKIVDTDLRGMYVLTSTEATEMGRYVVGEPHTAFTDALLAAIRASDDGTGREVRLGELYASTRQTLQRRQLPLPDADRMTPAAISSSGAAGLWTATSLPTRERRPSRLPARACCAARRRSGSCVSGDRRARPAQPKPGQRNHGCAEHSAGRAVHPGEQRCLLRRLLRSYPRPGEVVGARSVGHRWAERRTAEVCRATGSRVNTSLEPVTLTRAFEQMTFDVTIPQYAKAGPGGVALILNPRSDRPQWLAFGPSPEGRTIYPLICAKAKCINGVYEDFVEPTGSAVAKVAANEAVPVKLVRANGRLRFYVRNMLVGETPVDPGSLTDFRFAISAADTESWDIEVDNIVCQ
jgi:hypothetical protein